MIKSLVMGSTVENDQKFMCRVEEEGRREVMQINILMQNMFFLLQDPTRQKKDMQVEVSTFSAEKKKSQHGDGSFHIFSNSNILWSCLSILWCLWVLRALLLYYMILWFCQYMHWILLLRVWFDFVVQFKTGFLEGIFPGGKNRNYSQF